jgi:4-hydroxyphenylacetate 3-monooxygenase
MRRSGRQYLESLRDGRAVYFDGEAVKDVTAHPAFAPAARQVAATYDRAADPANADETTYVDPATGERYPSMWLLPRSPADLAVRQRGHRFWAEASYGLMGRTPDCVASVLTGFAATPHVFAAAGHAFAENVTRFYERARADDLYAVYAVNPLYGDRSKPAHQQAEPFLYAGAARERDDGIVVKGGITVATAAILADWVLVSYLVPLAPGDEDYAISVMVPTAAPGVRLYARRSYVPREATVFDYPLSSRFDETDALLVLDDVFVPWEHVFVYRDLKRAMDQWFETPAHSLSILQGLTRFCVKLDFAAGLALKLAELHSTVRAPAVQAQLGADVAMVAAALHAMVDGAVAQPVMRDGVAWPSPQFLYAGQSFQQQTVVNLMSSIRRLAGGSFITMPSSERALESPETHGDVERYFRAGSVPAAERVKLLSLIWDFVGTEFAGRQLQYEMFYSGPQQTVDVRAFKHFDWSRGRALVERCLSELPRREGESHGA